MSQPPMRYILKSGNLYIRKNKLKKKALSSRKRFLAGRSKAKIYSCQRTANQALNFYKEKFGFKRLKLIEVF